MFRRNSVTPCVELSIVFWPKQRPFFARNPGNTILLNGVSPGRQSGDSSRKTCRMGQSWRSRRHGLELFLLRKSHKAVRLHIKVKFHALRRFHFPPKTADGRGRFAFHHLPGGQIP